MIVSLDNPGWCSGCNPENCQGCGPCATSPKVDAMRAHVTEMATKFGWEESSGEGAFEFIQRKSYAQGVEDGITRRGLERDVLVVNLLRHTSLTKNQARALIDQWIDGTEPDKALFEPKDPRSPVEMKFMSDMLAKQEQLATMANTLSSLQRDSQQLFDTYRGYRDMLAEVLEERDKLRLLLDQQKDKS